MMSNVDAQDSEGRFLQVQIQTDSNCYKRKNASLILEKNLKLWSQAVVSGCNWMVVGYKTFDNHITKIDTVGVDEFSPNAEDKEQCYDFLNRLLDWIKAHLPASFHLINNYERFECILNMGCRFRFQMKS